MNIFSVGMISTAYFVRHSRRPSVCLSVWWCLSERLLLLWACYSIAASVSTTTSFSVSLGWRIINYITEIANLSFLVEMHFLFQSIVGGPAWLQGAKKIFVGSDFFRFFTYRCKEWTYGRTMDKVICRQGADFARPCIACCCWRVYSIYHPRDYMIYFLWLISILFWQIEKSAPPRTYFKIFLTARIKQGGVSWRRKCIYMTVTCGVAEVMCMK